MKKTLLFVLLLIFALSITATALAHPGGTDSQGGHIDHSTGEYHFHHGKDPHQHEDVDGDGVLDCPYDFEDTTGETSGSNSSYTSYENRNEAVVDTNTSQKTSDTSNTGTGVLIFYCSALAFTAVMFVIGGVMRLRDIIKPKREARLKRVKERKQVKQFEKEYLEKLKKYENKKDWF